MSSLRQMLANRANGALSHGPLTPQGKERSAQNALRHGLLAKCVVLENECPESFAASLSDHVDHLRPTTGLELDMVEEMVASHWRLRRAWAIETRLIDKQTASQPPGGDLDRMADAFSGLADGPALALIHRYEARLHLMYQRALHNLPLLRIAAVPNEPNPISGHLEP